MTIFYKTTSRHGVWVTVGSSHGRKRRQVHNRCRRQGQPMRNQDAQQLARANGQTGKELHSCHAAVDVTVSPGSKYQVLSLCVCTSNMLNTRTRLCRWWIIGPFLLYLTTHTRKGCRLWRHSKTKRQRHLTLLKLG